MVNLGIAKSHWKICLVITEQGVSSNNTKTSSQIRSILAPWAIYDVWWSLWIAVTHYQWAVVQWLSNYHHYAIHPFMCVLVITGKSNHTTGRLSASRRDETSPDELENVIEETSYRQVHLLGRTINFVSAIWSLLFVNGEWILYNNH